MDIGHSYIFPGDGSSHTEVKFRYMVFRPVVEEIVVGKIKSCSREGVHGNLFKNIYQGYEIITNHKLAPT